MAGIFLRGCRLFRVGFITYFTYFITVSTSNNSCSSGTLPIQPTIRFLTTRHLVTILTSKLILYYYYDFITHNILQTVLDLFL